MDCPKCGKKGLEDGVRFCRECGQRLGGGSEPMTIAEYERQIFRRIGYKTIQQGAGLMVLAILVAMANVMLKDFGLWPERYGKAAFIILFALGLLRFFIPMLIGGFRRTSPTSKKKAISREADQLPDSNIKPILIDDRVESPAFVSVTEHTTTKLRQKLP